MTDQEILERARRAANSVDLPTDRFEDLLRRRDRKRRNQRLAAGVVGITVFVAAVWIVTSGASTDHAQRPATEPSTVSSTDAAEDVVRGFLAAFGAFDPQAAMTYVADDADLRRLIDPPAPANEEGLSLLLALLEAQRYEQTITFCQGSPRSDPQRVSVICGFEFDAIASDVLGRGPFTGSVFRFMVRDGEIVEAGGTPDLERFSSQMRAPFAEWVAVRYPKDFEVMYGTTIPRFPGGFRRVFGRLTDESIRLWEQHTREYVKAVKQGTL